MEITGRQALQGMSDFTTPSGADEHGKGYPDKKRLIMTINDMNV